jgi:hypothetical protein
MSRTRSLFVVLGVLASALYVVPTSFAAPPSNDDFANATVITALPFSSTVGITEATTETGEPIDSLYYQGRSVWYSFTPAADAVVRIDPGSSFEAPFLVVYRADGPGFGGLARIAGDHWGSAVLQTLRVRAGTTYYIQGGDRYAVWGYTNTFRVNVNVVPPPPNDNFADAISFASIPFSDSRDLTGATIESGEPSSCGASPTASAWYAFTPTASGAYGAFGVSNVSVYTGTSLTDLANVACADWPGLYFHAEAGTTYYLQTYGNPPYGGGVSVGAVPLPNADFTFSPGDPSAVEDTAFSYWNNGYWDPTVDGWAWDFGDGTTATGADVVHRFASDGDYSVTITVSARGGRSNTATKTVQVRTHDVAILSLLAPDKGRVGRQGVITVGIGNTRYQDTVQVDLYKVTPQGDVLVGTSIQAVGVMRLKKTIVFSFNYVFTAEDAAISKVPFKAVATIHGARDAVNSDNMATSPPTLVTR